MHFDEHYREIVTLRDGERLLLRMIIPGDKQKLVEGFGRLSPQSRRGRFLAPKNGLSAQELRFFTEVDVRDHFAIGALVLDGEQERDGVGIARIIRLPEDPHCAEPAVVVVDEYQGRGIGRLLLERAMRAAAERGITHVRCHLLADNAPMRELLEQTFGPTELRRDGQMLIGDLQIPASLREAPATISPAKPAALVFELLRLVAQGAVKPMLFGLGLLERGARYWQTPEDD